jgi:hypothetical protein
MTLVRGRALRWVFALLVLCNIGFLMWGFWYRDIPNDPGHAPLPAVNADKMILLGTPGAVARLRPAVNNSAKKPAPAAGTTTATPRSCVSIGPFDTNELAQSGGKRLADAKLAYNLRSESSRIESSYWVYLPPYATRKEAEKKQKELTRRGITDHYLMQEAGMENTISLGLFSQAENARRRMEELASQGIRARQETRYRTRTAFWLDLDTDQPAALADQLHKMEWTGAEVHQRAGACGEEAAMSPAAAAGVTPAPAE